MSGSSLDLLKQSRKIAIYRRYLVPGHPQTKKSGSSIAQWKIKALNPDDDPEFRYISCAIQVAIKILCHPTLIDQMTVIGITISQTNKTEDAPVLFPGQYRDAER